MCAPCESNVAPEEIALSTRFSGHQLPPKYLSWLLKPIGEVGEVCFLVNP
jgi:hypothetical protein